MDTAKFLRTPLAAIWVTLLPASAAAQCVEFDQPEELFLRSDAVFLGKVVDHKPTGVLGVHQIADIGTLQVEQSWKGNHERDVQVGADRPFETGERYVVFAAGTPLSTTLMCGWTEPVEQAKRKLDWLTRSAAAFQSVPAGGATADELVQALRQFPAAIPGVDPSTGLLPPTERLRREIYDRLGSLGPAALPALCRGLGDPDVQVRRNVALFLGVSAGGWFDRQRPPLVIAECMPALVAALEDTDSRVRELTAQAIGATGAAGVSAVPALIRLLGSPSEGDRNTACIGLAGLGPAAKAALPALETALSDPSPDVQRFAKNAIEKIER